MNGPYRFADCAEFCMFAEASVLSAHASCRRGAPSARIERRKDKIGQK